MALHSAPTAIAIDIRPDIEWIISNQGPAFDKRHASAEESITAKAGYAATGNPTAFMFVDKRFERYLSCAFAVAALRTVHNQQGENSAGKDSFRRRVP
jgi:hypothetical protein